MNVLSFSIAGEGILEEDLAFNATGGQELDEVKVEFDWLLDGCSTSTVIRSSLPLWTRV